MFCKLERATRSNRKIFIRLVHNVYIGHPTVFSGTFCIETAWFVIKSSSYNF